MAGEILSPQMSLPIPGVGVTEGPQWATDNNSCLNIIDGHDHSPGYGAPITPAGMNISTDLSMGSNNLTAIRSLRMDEQASELVLGTDIDCLYDVQGDLYFNNGIGTPVQITSGNSVVGPLGAISNLNPPASATYVLANGTFVWQSDANTSATMDAGPIILRPMTINAEGVTLSPPNGLAASYTLTLPSALPVAGTKFLMVSSGGNMSDNVGPDSTTLVVSGNNLQVNTGGINTAQLADGAVTRAKLAAVGQQISSSCGSFTTTSGSYVDITNLTVTITATGRPVMVGLQGIGTANSIFGVAGAGSISVQILRDSTVITRTNSVGTSVFHPSSSLNYMDVPAAGTYTYKVQVLASSGTADIENVVLYAYPLA